MIETKIMKNDCPMHFKESVFFVTYDQLFSGQNCPKKSKFGFFSI